MDKSRLPLRSLFSGNPASPARDGCGTEPRSLLLVRLYRLFPRRSQVTMVAALATIPVYGLEAQSMMPNENCSEPKVNSSLHEGDRAADFMDAGAGTTTVSTYGTAIREVPMPSAKDGMQGLSRLYHHTFRFDVSYSAWGSPDTLVGGSFPVPNLSAANFDDGDPNPSVEDEPKMVQPRPGTMPGLYLYQETSSGAFYHYGGPLESGASPQTTAEYTTTDSGSGPWVYYNQLSGAQLWHYNPGTGTAYVEIKHVDGTVARFESFDPYKSTYSSGGVLWRLERVIDPYDNVAEYAYDGLERLVQVDFPSGRRILFDYNPTSGGWASWTWSNTQSGLQVRYEQVSGTTTHALSDQTWGIVFKDANGTTGGTHFALRPHRIYSAVRKVQEEQLTADQPYVASAVVCQIVHEFTFDGVNGVLTESNNAHVLGTTFDSTLDQTSPLPSRVILETSFDTTSKRVDSQVKDQVAVSLDFAYTTGVRTMDLGDLPSGSSLSAVEVTDAEGNTRFYEYHAATGKLYSITTTPNTNSIGSPRANASITIGGSATTEVEPTKIEIYRIFGTSSCTCQKPIEVRTKATRAGSTEERIVYYEYDSVSKLVTKRSIPNPTTVGGQPTHVDYGYSYVQAKTGSQTWGAWLPDEEITPDGTWEYDYDDWLNRADATQHGRIPGKVTRQIAGVRIQSTLSGSPATTSTVSEVLYRNLSNSPGGLSQSGDISGQPRRIVDGDGVTQTFEYSDEGWLEVEWEHGSETKRVYAHDTAGNVTSVTDRATAGTSTHALVWSFPSQSGFGLVYEAESTSGTPVREIEYYYDRYGHLAVQRRNNLGSDGYAPTKHGASSTPRAWVESQWHYQHHQLWDTYEDRQPLDEAAGSDRFLQTLYTYRDNGQLEATRNPNGGMTEYQYDGYGTLFTTVIKSPSGTVSVTQPLRLINEFLELTILYDKVSSTDELVTSVTRNDSGAITQVIEPETDDPFTGFPGATGGAAYQFSLDELGRVTKVVANPSSSSSTELIARELRHDQLGRKIWQRDHVLGFGSGDRYSAWRYQGGKETWLQTFETTGVDPTTYVYDGTTGFLDSVTDGFGSTGNKTEYAYHSKTGFVSSVTQTDQDPLSGTRVTSSEYSVDAFGNVLMMRSTGSTNLDHVYGYNSLGRVDRYTDPDSKLQKFLPDGLGRVVEHVRVGSGSDYIRNRSTFVDFGASEGDGRTKVARFDHLDHPTITHYDFAGRPFIVQNPGGGTAPTASSKNEPMCLYAEYDLASRLAAVYDGDDGKTVYWRDGPGRLIMRELVALNDDFISTWNSKDVIERDEVGRIKEANMWGGGPALSHALAVATEQFDVDSLGRTHEERYQFNYASNNILAIASSYSTGNPYRSDLDYIDNLSSASAPLSMDFEHDDIGRLSVIDWTGTGSASQLAEYGWAGGLRRTREVRYAASATPAGSTEFTYDSHSRLTGITDEIDDGVNPPVVKSQFTYEYDLASNLTKETYDKVDTSLGDRFGYDAYHRLTSAAMGVTSMTGGMPTGYSSGAMHTFLTYGLDRANNREDTFAQDAIGSSTVDYEIQDGSHPQGPSNRYDTVDTGTSLTLEYDNRGNLTYDGQFYYCYDFLSRLQEVYQVTDATSSSSSTSSSATQSSSSSARFAVTDTAVLRSTRDAIRDGIQDFQARLPNEIRDPVFRARLRASVPGGAMRVSGGPAGSSATSSMSTGVDLELIAVYAYDAFNRRIMTVEVQTFATQFHTWDGWRQVADYVQAGSPPYDAEPVKEFVWGARLDELVSYRRRVGSSSSGYSWENYFVLHGGQDTGAKLIDSNGDIVETYEYDPYGKASVYAGSSTTPTVSSMAGLPFLWKGARVDSRTGLSYMRNRYYSTKLGRFLSRDPLGVWADAVNAGNGYVYCGNRSLSMGDPFGLQSDDVPFVDPGSLTLEDLIGDLYPKTPKVVHFWEWQAITCEESFDDIIGILRERGDPPFRLPPVGDRDWLWEERYHPFLRPPTDSGDYWEKQYKRYAAKAVRKGIQKLNGRYGEPADAKDALPLREPGSGERLDTNVSFNLDLPELPKVDASLKVELILRW